MSEYIQDARVLRGMEKQLRIRQDRLNAGDKSIGWKVGFGTPASQERLRIDAPLVGFLTENALLSSGAKVSIEGWGKPAVECEVAIYMGTDLHESVNRETTRAAIASIGPAFELADVRFPPDDVEMILADNIYNRHVILGRADPSRAGCVLDGLEARIYRNGEAAARTTDLQALTGDVIDIVSHVAKVLSALGERLRAGEFIIAGTIVPHLWVETKENVMYTLAPIDTIRIFFA
jgi:2-oxo-hept-3-ene-1,7-dioate hydratase